MTPIAPRVRPERLEYREEIAALWEGFTGWIRAVPAREIPEADEIASETVWDVAEALGLPRVPGIAFFEFCPPDHPYAVALKPGQEFLGCTGHVTGPREISVHARMSRELTQRVTAHEVRHVWQLWTGATGSTDDLERDAYRFDAAWMARRSR